MTTLIVKPGTSKGYVVLVPSESSDVPTITLSDGTIVRGKFLNDNEGRKQYVFPTTLYNQTDLTLNLGGKTQKLANGKQSYEGDSIESLKPRDKGSIGAGGQIIGGGGLGGAQQIGGFGVAPEDLSAQFPKPQTSFTDPIQFSKEFGKIQLGRLSATNMFAKELALDNIDTELQGLKNFAPAAAALKRDMIATDNAFNQGQRTDQINKVLPDVLKGLKTQTADAETYASGRAPDSIIDRGLELQTRAAGADIAAASGFGGSSIAAKGVNALMSAKERIGLSQYGNQLKQSNAQERANLELAPTEYSNAGGQINVTPSMSGSQLQQNIWGSTNQATLISPESALSSTVQQNQWNTQILNDFAMSLFNYKVGLSNAVAAAGQVSVNTGVGLDQQKQARDEYSKQMNKTQKANQTHDIITGVMNVGAAAIKFFM